MKQPKNPDRGQTRPLSASNEPAPPSGTVFPGKPHMQPQQNLAVQRSLMEIFDEFTEVVSGELKSMNLDEAENERFKR